MAFNLCSWALANCYLLFVNRSSPFLLSGRTLLRVPARDVHRDPTEHLHVHPVLVLGQLLLCLTGCQEVVSTFLNTGLVLLSSEGPHLHCSCHVVTGLPCLPVCSSILPCSQSSLVIIVDPSQYNDLSYLFTSFTSQSSYGSQYQCRSNCQLKSIC